MSHARARNNETDSDLGNVPFPEFRGALLFDPETCISCNLCEDIASEVFHVPAGETCSPRKGHEKLLGDSEVEERTREAAESCPVEVIQLEED